MLLVLYIETDTSFAIRRVNEQVIKVLDVSPGRVRRASIFEAIFKDHETRRLILSKMNAALDKLDVTFSFQTSHKVGGGRVIRAKWSVDVDGSDPAEPSIRFTGHAGYSEGGSRGMATSAELSEVPNIDMHLATSVQSVLIPRRTPYFRGVNVGASYVPKRAIGGGFYFFIPSREDELVLVMGQVPAVGHAAVYLKTLLRMTADLNRRFMADPSRAMAELYAFPKQTVGRGFRLSLIWCYLNVRKGFMKYGSAGMPSQLLIRRGATSAYLLDQTGPSFGTDDATWSEETLNLSAGDRLIFYLPGFLDVTAKDNVTLDFSMLKSWVEEENHERVHEAKQNLLQRTRRFIHPNPLPDDLGLVLIDML